MTIKDASFGIIFTLYIIIAFGIAGAIDYEEYYGGRGVDVVDVCVVNG